MRISLRLSKNHRQQYKRRSRFLGATSRPSKCTMKYTRRCFASKSFCAGIWYVILDDRPCEVHRVADARGLFAVVVFADTSAVLQNAGGNGLPERTVGFFGAAIEHWFARDFVTSHMNNERLLLQLSFFSSFSIFFLAARNKVTAADSGHVLQTIHNRRNNGGLCGPRSFPPVVAHFDTSASEVDAIQRVCNQTETIVSVFLKQQSKRTQTHAPIARLAAIASLNRTVPKPLGRPSGEASTSTRSTLPTGRKRSLSICHVVSHGSYHTTTTTR